LVAPPSAARGPAAAAQVKVNAKVAAQNTHLELIGFLFPKPSSTQQKKTPLSI
jgi:hypothetical protein